MKSISPLLLALVLISCDDLKEKIHGKHRTVTDSTQHSGNTMLAQAEQKQLMDAMMTKMHSIRPTGNNEVDFAVMMTEHHKAAVEMSKLLLYKGTDSALLGFGRQVIAAQEKEIALMGVIIEKNKNAPASPDAAAFQSGMNAAMEAMMKHDTKIYNDIQLDYAAQMIPHHQSAVEMARAYLKNGKDAGLVKLCKQIIDAQLSEINWLKQWITSTVV